LRERDANRVGGKQQDKQKEIAFFDAHAAADEYDVFTPEANARLVEAFVRLSRLKPGAQVVDLGCGSGAFTHLLRRAGYDCVGLDISPKLVELGRRKRVPSVFSPIALTREVKTCP
jgi:ubiquinone/menaquinone biosynthesis C-methylase UbiE